MGGGTADTTTAEAGARWVHKLTPRLAGYLRGRLSVMNAFTPNTNDRIVRGRGAGGGVGVQFERPLGTWLAGLLVELDYDFYRLRYDDYDNSFDVGAVRFSLGVTFGRGS